jgi:hypothetical protein
MTNNSADPRNDPTDCESKVAIRDHQRVGVEVRYVSADHDHGHCVIVPKWSRDSRFFVYSMENADGHQGWHDDIMILSRAKGRLHHSA